MASVRPRENTFKVLLSNFPKRPSFEDLHLFVHHTLGLRLDQILRLQMNHAQNCVHVKCIDLTTAQDTVIQHDGQHELEVNKKRYKVRLQMDDGGVEIKVHDVSENVSKEELFAVLKQYGDVVSAKELFWSDGFACKGIPSGVWVVKMNLRRHIKSFINIQGEQSLVTYRNQPQTCRHCMNLSHPGSTCVENKKLLGQKIDLDSRLKRAANTGSAPTSFADVLNNPAPLVLTPSFVRGNTSQTQSPSATLCAPSTSVPPTAANLGTVAKLNDHEMEQSGIGKTTTDIGKQLEETTTTIGSAAVAAIVADAAVAVAASSDALNEPSSDSKTLAIVEAERNKGRKSTHHVSAFKIPTNPVLSKSLTMEISESESNESSTEGTPFQKVKRRSKKPKLDSSVSNANKSS